MTVNATKIGAVHLRKTLKDGAGWMNEWHFISEDGRLDLTMKPYYDHYTSLLPSSLFGMKTHQVHDFGQLKGRSRRRHGA